MTLDDLENKNKSFIEFLLRFWFTAHFKSEWHRNGWR